MAHFKEIDERIKQCLADSECKPDELEEIELDEIQFGSFDVKTKAEIEKYKNLTNLSVNNCGLNSLSNLPNIPNLLVLSIQDNQITGAELSKLAIYKKLQILFLGGNKIKSIDELKSISGLQQISQLSLEENPIVEAKDYRAQVFSIFKQLSVLDGVDEEGNPIDEGNSDEDLVDVDDGEEDDFEGDDDDEDAGEEDDEEDEDEDEEEPKKKTKN